MTLTATQSCAREGYHEMISVVIKGGANPSSRGRDEEPRPLLFVAIQKRTPKYCPARGRDIYGLKGEPAVDPHGSRVGKNSRCFTYDSLQRVLGDGMRAGTTSDWDRRMIWLYRWGRRCSREGRREHQHFLEHHDETPAWLTKTERPLPAPPHTSHRLSAKVLLRLRKGRRCLLHELQIYALVSLLCCDFGDVSLL